MSSQSIINLTLHNVNGNPVTKLFNFSHISEAVSRINNIFPIGDFKVSHLKTVEESNATLCLSCSKELPIPPSKPLLNYQVSGAISDILSFINNTITNPYENRSDYLSLSPKYRNVIILFLFNETKIDVRSLAYYMDFISSPHGYVQSVKDHIRYEMPKITVLKDESSSKLSFKEYKKRLLETTKFVKLLYKGATHLLYNEFERDHMRLTLSYHNENKKRWKSSCLRKNY